MELLDVSTALRPWRENDASAAFAACQDPEILRWIPVIPTPYPREDIGA